MPQKKERVKVSKKSRTKASREKKKTVPKKEKVSSIQREKISCTEEKEKRSPKIEEITIPPEPRSRICPKCGRELSLKAIYCGQCGANLIELFRNLQS